MARIKQLSFLEAQKIAAGQVVERPANVVKELIENAIDAGATQITIYIQDAGKSLIRVVDNGCGMDTDDAHHCFKHHATSKITGIHDLATLATHGFRGEALSSIAAVSKVTLITKEQQATHALQLTLENAQVINQTEVSANTGTDIRIADLFYNVPARKKFLKTNETELRQITVLFQAFCLDYQQLHFKLYSQNALVFNCPPTLDSKQRIAQIWDHSIANQMLPIQITTQDFTIQGMISNHTYNRYDRSCIFLFVNNRWIKNHGLTKALLNGYLNVLPSDKFPLAHIAITLDATQIDVNIDPRKEEVRFLQPRSIETAVTKSVKEALEKNLSAQLQKPVVFNEHPITNGSLQPTSYKSGVHSEFITGANTYAALPHRAHTPLQEAPFGPYPSDNSAVPLFIPDPNLDSNSHFENEKISCESLITKEQSNYHIIGQLHTTYILIEQKDGLFLVDQHAAHERVLYELFSTRFENIAMVQLMFPHIISLASWEAAVLQPYLNIFTKNNIAIELFDNNQCIVQAVPVHLKEVNLEELLREMIGAIIENQKLDAEQLHKQINEKLHAQMACKAAVKAGDILTLAQMDQLLQDLDKTTNRFTCPHGRPTGWGISLYEIEKKFKRKL